MHIFAYLRISLRWNPYHGWDGVSAAVPNTLDVDVEGAVPDLIAGVDRVVVRGVHDA